MHTRVCMCINAYVHECLWVHGGVHAYKCVFISVCIKVRLVCVSIYVHVCIYCMNVWTHVYMCIWGVCILTIPNILMAKMWRSQLQKVPVLPSLKPSPVPCKNILMALKLCLPGSFRDHMYPGPMSQHVFLKYSLKWVNNTGSLSSLVPVRHMATGHISTTARHNLEGSKHQGELEYTVI